MGREQIHIYHTSLRRVTKQKEINLTFSIKFDDKKENYGKHNYCINTLIIISFTGLGRLSFICYKKDKLF